MYDKTISMTKQRVGLHAVILLSVSAVSIGAQPIERLEFVNASVADVLVALGLAAGRIVVPDDTVEGVATYRFVETDFHAALAAVMRRFGLFATEADGIVIVSRSAVDLHDDGSVSIRSNRVDPETLLRRLSRETQTPILFDPLPPRPLSLFAEKMQLHDVLDLVCQSLDGFEVLAQEQSYLVRRQQGALTEPSRNTTPSEPAATRRIELTHVSAATLMDLLPSRSLADVELRLDRAHDVVTIAGPVESAERVGQIIAQIDVPLSGRAYHSFRLSHVAWQDFLSRLPQELARLPLIQRPGSSIGTLLATAEQAAEFAHHIELFDTPSERHLFDLQHITTETLLSSLPPTASRSQIVPAGDSSRFFFLGSRDAREEFAADLASIDCPVPRIRYELLVIQYQVSESYDHEFGLANRIAAPESPHAILGNLGSLLSVSFDIVSAFGYHFAAQLSSQLSETRAQIIADVVLRGSSGQRVRFQNTDTFRYREPELSGTASASAGVVREITSGLVVDLTGHLVHDRTLLLDVVVSLSKRGIDVSAQGNPPPTSERMIQTKLRAETGQPIAIGRFVFQEQSHGSQGPPFLAGIPLVSDLLGMAERQVEAGELAIYLIPHVDELPNASVGVNDELFRLAAALLGEPR